MNRVFVFLVLGVLLISGCTQTVPENGGVTAEERAKLLCPEMCRQVLAAGMSLSEGPCLSELNWSTWNIDDWVCDIAHSPRQEVDNNPANQCQEYRSGQAHHFVEVSPECEFIRAV